MVNFPGAPELIGQLIDVDITSAMSHTLRGEPVAEQLPEVLARAEDSAAPGREKLAWSPVRLTYPPEGEGWRLDPEIVYFYTDGSCTPARISWTQPGAPDSDAETFLLTVTGYLFEQERRR